MPPDSRDARGPAGALKRPRFEPGDYLVAGDLADEQGWRRQRFRRHNRHLHGWGIVCGLWVAPALDAARPWAVLVCPGYALGPYGDEILVGCPAPVDLREWLWCRPSPAATAYVAIRHAESAGAPRPYRDTDCGCSDRRAGASLVAESWRIDVLWERPVVGAPAPFDLCHDPPPCRPCPDNPYVLLAGVLVPLDEGERIEVASIDIGVSKRA
jgi:hypothetical protein